MARQSTTPVEFNKTTRKDHAVTMTSDRAGRVTMLGYAPLLPGDSASGRVGIDLELAEMPKPLLNAVHMNVQVWFCPKSALPDFSGMDELRHAMTGLPIKALGVADRPAPSYYRNSTAFTSAFQTYFGKVMGLHFKTGQSINSDVFNSLIHVYNFRLAAHSSKLQERGYFGDTPAPSTDPLRAFWPSSRFSRVVPDYERALIVGALDLDVAAGRIPVSGIGLTTTSGAQPSVSVKETDGSTATYPVNHFSDNNGGRLRVLLGGASNALPQIFAEMGGETVQASLADIDMARTTKSFAQLRASYAGAKLNKFSDDDTIVSLLMQGLNLPPEVFDRPWLLDSKRVPVGFAERFATDAANLEKSLTRGRASATLSVNVPRQETGGIILYTVELLPERVDERQEDIFFGLNAFDQLPNALRDVQRVEPVDLVKNSRLDVLHTTPDGLYGYEPMNNVWQRDFTRLGGKFYQATVGAGFSENRANIWQSEIVNPTFSASHYLAPAQFPHDVFSDTDADAFEVVARHSLSITGLTQFGDVLAEDNNDYEAVQEA